MTGRTITPANRRASNTTETRHTPPSCARTHSEADVIARQA
jgi:hypothetical protein